MATLIDYTKMRLGKVVRQWEYRKKDGTTGIGCTKIEKCPKCGLKGERVRYDAGKPTAYDTYTHQSEIDEVIPGFPLNHIRKQCIIKVG